MNETIKMLKELSERTSYFYLKNTASGLSIVREDESPIVEIDDVLNRPFFLEKEAELIVLFRRELPDLLTYIEELEKKVEAAKVFAEAVKKMEVDAGFQGNSTDYKCLINQRDAALDTYNQAIK